METIRSTKCPHCWAALAGDVGHTCPHCHKPLQPAAPLPSSPPPTPKSASAVAPVPSRPARLSQPGRVLVAVLVGMGIYALARCGDQVDRLRFINGMRNGTLAHQVRIGATTLAALHAKARALDHRNGYFLAASWIGSLASWAAYRNWQARTPLLPHTTQTRLIERAVVTMWAVALGAQFLRMTSSSFDGSLSGAHTDAMVNLLSRAVLIPAVAGSIVLVRRREGLPLRTRPPAPPLSPAAPHPPFGSPPPPPSRPVMLKGRPRHPFSPAANEGTSKPWSEGR